MVVGLPLDQYKAAVAIATCRQYNHYFRCTIITKCILHLCYSQYLVLITYILLVYNLYNRISPHHPSTAAIAIVDEDSWTTILAQIKRSCAFCNGGLVYCTGCHHFFHNTSTRLPGDQEKLIAIPNGKRDSNGNPA